VEVVASLSQGRTAAAQCGLFTHKSVPVIFEPPCKISSHGLIVCKVSTFSGATEDSHRSPWLCRSMYPTGIRTCHLEYGTSATLIVPKHDVLNIVLWRLCCSEVL